MRINHNIGALNAWKNLTATDNAMSKSLEKLSSGLRISKAADDAAGLAISEKMRGQARGLMMAQRNALDAISLIQTAEGALNETHSILQRMRELAVQSASDSLTDTDRAQLQAEVTQLIDEIDRIGDTTEFNTKPLLKGTLGSTYELAGTLTTDDGFESFDVSGAAADTYAVTTAAGTNVGVKIQVEDGAGQIQIIDDIEIPATGQTRIVNFDHFGIKMTLNENIAADSAVGGDDTVTVTAGAAFFHIGANASQSLSVSIADMRSAALSVETVNISTRAGADTAISTIDNAINTVSSQRAALGAVQNRLEYTIANLGAANENLTAAESRIRDVDMAIEMANFTKTQILLQSGTAMLAQANQKPQAILQLLR
ncbi:MAG: flagellin [Firmicutes bacterium]|jgi:flagellin|nr:flagellin [Bacillota bacterium]